MLYCMHMVEKSRRVEGNTAYQSVLDNLLKCPSEILRQTCPERVLPYGGNGFAFLLPGNLVFLRTDGQSLLHSLDTKYDSGSGQPIDEHLHSTNRYIPEKYRAFIIADSQVFAKVCEFLTPQAQTSGPSST